MVCDFYDVFDGSLCVYSTNVQRVYFLVSRLIGDVGISIREFVN